MKVLLLGATGLVGQHCMLSLLNKHCVESVVAPTRRTLGIKDRKVENVLVDFDRLDEYPELFQVDVILCCLGTTIKQAGSRENFKKVDFEYCMDAAELGRAQKAKSFILVSAMGASKNSLFYYSRVKGELEEHLKELEYHRLSIYQPSLLLGERDEHRAAESLASYVMPKINPFMVKKLEPYRAIAASTVAHAMVNECVSWNDQAVPNKPQVNIYTYPQIVALSENLNV